jgi:hypothetical protein
MVSCKSQKQHFLQPFYFLLARVFIVSKKFLLRKHIYLYLQWDLWFQRMLTKEPSICIHEVTILDFHEKTHMVVSFQRTLSDSKWTIVNLWNKCNKEINLLPDKTLLKPMLLESKIKHL